jgi:fructose-bisphosphate aldolase class I
VTLRGEIVLQPLAARHVDRHRAHLPFRGSIATSGGTIERRFAAVGVESTEENRLAYRQLLVTTEGAGQWISGVILFDETIRQRAADGTSLPEVLERQGIIPGIKVDQGAKPLALALGEKVTEGLDGLRDRLAEYRELGARFAKWRAVIGIGADIPSEYCIWVNAHALARFAALAQEAGLVPIVEPEVLMDGGHRIARSYAVTFRVQHAVFRSRRAAAHRPRSRGTRTGGGVHLRRPSPTRSSA